MRDITIEDRESLKAFLDGVEEPRRQQAAVFIAARAALRAAPELQVFFDFEHNKKPLKPLPVLRSLLISSVAATMPTEDIRFSADAAAVTAAAFAAAVTWGAIQRDAALWVEDADAETGNLSIDIAPLWDGANPLDVDWQFLLDRMRDDPSGADWSFWITWYQGILDGVPQNWPLLHEIATTDRIDWDAPAQEVNDKINGIVTLYRLDEAIKNHALDRKVVFNAQTNRLAAEDIEERDLEEIVKSLRAALRRFVSRVTQDNQGNRMGAHIHAACKVWIKRFRAEISKNKDSTSGLAHCLRMNQLELQTIVRNERFETDGDLNRLLNELADVESQIMVAAPEVLEARKAANLVKIELYEADYLVAAKRMTHGMMLDSEGSLEMMMAWVFIPYMMHPYPMNKRKRQSLLPMAHYPEARES